MEVDKEKLRQETIGADIANYTTSNFETTDDFIYTESAEMDLGIWLV